MSKRKIKFKRNDRVTDGHTVYRLLDEATKGWWRYYGGGDYLVHHSNLRFVEGEKT